MVKVREGLPLIDGQTTTEDSASLAAQMIAQQQHGYYNPSRLSFEMLNEDLKTVSNLKADDGYGSLNTSGLFASK
nr:hypothetical protein [Psychrobacter sp. PraFG1]UNK05724.1 hypothetical protein MN210_02525 [Psychrobacter sp. PraFG1]